MSESDVHRIQERSGIEIEAGETAREYVRRVGESCDVEKHLIEEIVTRIENQFAPPEERPDEDGDLEQFLEAVSSSPNLETSDNSIEQTDPSDPVESEGTRSDEAGSDRTSRQPSATSTATDHDLRSEESYGNRSSTGMSTGLRVRRFFRGGVIHRILFSTTDRFQRGARQYRLKDFWGIIAVAVIGAYVFLPALGHQPLVRWDESIYANVARHMVQNDRWLIPHLYLHPQRGGVELQPFLEKPPLVFWLQGISASLFGVNRFAIRLPIALFAILAGVVTYRFGEHLFDRVAALVGVCAFHYSDGFRSQPRWPYWEH